VRLGRAIACSPMQNHAKACSQLRPRSIERWHPQLRPAERAGRPRHEPAPTLAADAPSRNARIPSGRAVLSRERSARRPPIPPISIVGANDRRAPVGLFVNLPMASRARKQRQPPVRPEGQRC